MTLSEKLVVRPATGSDYEAVLDINRNVYSGFDYVSSMYFYFQHHPDVMMFIAELDGRVVSTALAPAGGSGARSVSCSSIGKEMVLGWKLQACSKSAILHKIMGVGRLFQVYPLTVRYQNNHQQQIGYEVQYGKKGKVKQSPSKGITFGHF